MGIAASEGEAVGPGGEPDSGARVGAVSAEEPPLGTPGVGALWAALGGGFGTTIGFVEVDGSGPSGFPTSP